MLINKQKNGQYLFPLPNTRESESVCAMIVLTVIRRNEVSMCECMQCTLCWHIQAFKWVAGERDVQV